MKRDRVPGAGRSRGRGEHLKRPDGFFPADGEHLGQRAEDLQHGGVLVGIASGRSALLEETHQLHHHSALGRGAKAAQGERVICENKTKKSKVPQSECEAESVAERRLTCETRDESAQPVKRNRQE